ncbi:MAG TPA: beta-ketoacyl-ACP synthase III [Candidatus Polarisedimenticolia bacterium]|nr:beta-ketoacyl-ACP synthase III [Candidatus Polarisedimenticolia bacterium]
MSRRGLRAVIRGTGSSLPEKILTNRDLEKMVDTSDDWIASRTGIRERRIAGPDEYMSHFATRAAEQALQAAGIAGSEVDLVICATVTPDMPIPATACIIQDNLGARNAAAFDMAAGCSGFIYALAAGDLFVSSGAYRKVVVIGAELLSKYTDWTDRSTCVLFGDGAGAVVLTPGEAPFGVLATAMHADGRMADFIYVPAGGTREPASERTVAEHRHFIRMKGNETFKMAVRSMEETSREVLKASDLTPEEIGLFIPHQANRRIIDAVGNRLGLREDQVYLNIERVGNTSAASIPIALDEAVRAGRVRRGDNLVFAAFGTGLTWGAAVCKWGW